MTYPPEIKAHALALIEQGYSVNRAHREIVKAYTEDAPSVDALYDWRRELQISPAEQDDLIISNAREIARRAQRLIIDTLETMEPDAKQLVNLNIVAGTAVDKVHQAKQLQRGPDVHQHLTLLIRQAEIELREGREPLMIEEAASDV